MRRRDVEAAVVPPKVPKLRSMPVSLRTLVRRYGGLHGDPLAWTLRQIPGGVRAVIRLLEVSTHDPEAQRFSQLYRRVAKRARGTVALAEVLDHAQLQPRDFVTLVSRCAYDFNIDLSKTIAAVHYPRLMKASVKRALAAEATDERKLHFQAAGYLPTGKGIQLGIATNHLTSPDDRPPVPGHPPSFDRTARQVVRDLPPSE